MAAMTVAAPAARFENLVMTEADGEVLIYDQIAHHIHHLNGSSAAVWRLCDGHRPVAGIALEAGMSEDMVRLALTRLADANLLDGEAAEFRIGGQSRRALVKKAAVAGAIAAPAVVSVTAPAAASHSSSACHTPPGGGPNRSGPGCPCQSGDHCLSGSCVGGQCQ